MSPTSYQTAPPRVGGTDTIAPRPACANLAGGRAGLRAFGSLGRRGGRRLGARVGAGEEGGGLVDLGRGLLDLGLVRPQVAVALEVGVGLGEEVAGLAEQALGLLGHGAGGGAARRAAAGARARAAGRVV